jgi:hypothetical protein
VSSLLTNIVNRHIFDGVDVDVVEMRLQDDDQVSQSFEHTFQSVVFRVEVRSNEQNGVADAPTTQKHQYKHADIREVDNHQEKTSHLAIAYTTRPTNIGISVYTLQLLGASTYFKRRLFRLMVDLPTWVVESRPNVPTDFFREGETNSVRDDVLPWTLFVSRTGSSSLHVVTEGPATWKLTYRQRTAKGAEHSEMNSVPSSTYRSVVAVTLDDTKPIKDDEGPSVSNHVLFNERQVSRVYWDAIQSELNTHAGDIAGGK